MPLLIHDFCHGIVPAQNGVLVRMCTTWVQYPCLAVPAHHLGVVSVSVTILLYPCTSGVLGDLRLVIHAS